MTDTVVPMGARTEAWDSLDASDSDLLWRYYSFHYGVQKDPLRPYASPVLYAADRARLEQEKRFGENRARLEAEKQKTALAEAEKHT